MRTGPEKPPGCVTESLHSTGRPPRVAAGYSTRSRYPPPVAVTVPVREPNTSRSPSATNTLSAATYGRRPHVTARALFPPAASASRTIGGIVGVPFVAVPESTRVPASGTGLMMLGPYPGQPLLCSGVGPCHPRLGPDQAVREQDRLR